MVPDPGESPLADRLPEEEAHDLLPSRAGAASGAAAACLGEALADRSCEPVEDPGGIPGDRPEREPGRGEDAVPSAEKDRPVKSAFCHIEQIFGIVLYFYYAYSVVESRI